MFNALFQFLDTEPGVTRDTDDSEVELTKSSASRLLHSAQVENKLSWTQPSRESPTEAKTASERAGQRLYESGMRQKAKQRRTAEENETKQKLHETMEMQRAPQIGDISRDIVRELKRQDVVSANERWVQERNARRDQRLQAKMAHEIAELAKYREHKWCDTSKLNATYLNPLALFNKQIAEQKSMQHSIKQSNKKATKEGKLQLTTRTQVLRRAKMPIEERLLEEGRKANMLLDQKRFLLHAFPSKSKTSSSFLV